MQRQKGDDEPCLALVLAESHSNPCPRQTMTELALVLHSALNPYPKPGNNATINNLTFF